MYAREFVCSNAFAAHLTPILQTSNGPNALFDLENCHFFDQTKFFYAGFDECVMNSKQRLLKYNLLCNQPTLNDGLMFSLNWFS